MIGRKVFLSVISVVAACGLATQAWSAELTGEYLHGKWTIHGSDCADPSAEFVIFRETGAVEDVRENKLEAAGFWELKDDIVVVHVVASPDFFKGAGRKAAVPGLPRDEYHAFRIRVVPFNVEPDQFGAVGILGEQINKAEFHRCKT